MSQEKLLDEYVQRLQNLKPFNIYDIKDDGSVEPWWPVTSEVVKDLLLYEQGLGHQVQIISGEINKWHRMVAQCQRVWQIEERKYRIWRDRLYLANIDPVEKPKDWKKPTGAMLEAMYRTHDDYSLYYAAIERAEEAFNACQGIVDALRAKRDMMKSYVIRNRDDAAPQLSV